LLFGKPLTTTVEIFFLKCVRRYNLSNINESIDLKQKLTGYSAPIYQSKKQINRLRKGFGFLHTHVYNIITLRLKIREIQSKDIKGIVIR
jgi:hypothetical protein